MQKQITKDSSLKDRIIYSGKSFTLYHTHTLTEESLQNAIKSKKSIDLDICVDNHGKPYFGHGLEYYDINKTIDQIQ